SPAADAPSTLADSPPSPVADAPPPSIDAGGQNARLWLTGVDLSGAEFGENNLPGTYGMDYIYPNSGEIDYFMGKGLRVFRIAFRWERLQRSLNAAFDATELGHLDDIVGYATRAGAQVIIDPHNFARYGQNVVGSQQLPSSALADFWSRLATHFAGNP